VHHFSTYVDGIGGMEVPKVCIIIKSLLNLNFLILNQSSCNCSTVRQLNDVEKFQIQAARFNNIRKWLC